MTLPLLAHSSIKPHFGKCIINISQNNESNISVNCSRIFFSESKQNETLYMKEDFTCGLVCVNLFLAHRIRISEILPWDGKSYLIHAFLPRLSREGFMHWLYLTSHTCLQVTSLLCLGDVILV